MILENIKDVENNIKKLTTPTQDIIRNRSIPIIKNVASSRPLNNIDRVLLTLYKTSRLFLKNNPDLVLTKADKGNLTVALNRSKYINNINIMLQEKHTYTLVKKNPINKMVTNLRNLLLLDGKRKNTSHS